MEGSNAAVSTDFRALLALFAVFRHASNDTTVTAGTLKAKPLLYAMHALFAVGAPNPTHNPVEFVTRLVRLEKLGGTVILADPFTPPSLPYTTQAPSIPGCTTPLLSPPSSSNKDPQHPLFRPPPPHTFHPHSKFVTQLARLVKPGGTVILADFCRKAGPMTQALSKRFKRMDQIFETAGNWKSAEDFKDMMGKGDWGGGGCVTDSGAVACGAVVSQQPPPCHCMLALSHSTPYHDHTAPLRHCATVCCMCPVYTRESPWRLLYNA